jgi:hypothetical protein
MIGAVVTHHRNPFRSGVARFNELLAEQLGVPFVGLLEAEGLADPLLSFKASELGEDAALVERLLAGWQTPRLFLHEFCDTPLERSLVAASTCVYASNADIASRLRELHPDVREVWTPGLIVTEARITPADWTVFSFGMAHKIRTGEFRRLRALLDDAGRTYAVRVSAANHETATLRDAELIFGEMHAIFPERLYFLGNLSDLAIVDELSRATFFAAFFRPALRANNTSVASAMERGAVVITNLDEHSPPELRHMDNLLDISQLDALPVDPLVHARIGVRAMETGRDRSWQRLVERLGA